MRSPTSKRETSRRDDRVACQKPPAARRPRFKNLGYPLVLLVFLISPTMAQHDDPEKTAVDLLTPAAGDAIERGLEYLASSQHDDGSFGSGSFRGNVAVCGLAGLALMSNGSTPDRGPYGQQVGDVVEYLLANTSQSGFIASPRSASHGPMYGHGFATLLLAQAYGMSTDQAELREKLSKAVELIVGCQNDDGGWRYQPQRAEADLSVTICQVMALRAAKNSGLNVPGETIDRCIDYVKRSQNADGGFMYMPGGGDSAFARSAAGVVALYSAGVYQGPEISKGIDYLLQFKPQEGVIRRGETYYFYGHYYAVQAMWQHGGDPWDQWYPAVREELVARQRDDGSWTSPISLDYATAMSCIILQIPNNCLPIFQR